MKKTFEIKFNINVNTNRLKDILLVLDKLIDCLISEHCTDITVQEIE